jgi:hypothetical protein
MSRPDAAPESTNPAAVNAAAGSAEPASRPRTAGRLRRVPAIAWVLGLALLLRVAVLALAPSTVFTYYGGDSTRYLRLEISGVNGLFSDTAMPAGYPGFLAVLHGITRWLPLTVVVQHLLGLGTAALSYLALLRVGAPRWAAVVPAIIIGLSGDQVFLEHGIFTEALWIPLVVLALYLLCRAVGDEPRRVRWLAAGGVALAASALTRNVSEFLPVLLAVWAAVAFPAPWRRRLAHGGAILVPAVLVILVYIVIAKPISDGYSGITENSGFSAYSRVGQFADCTAFTPPAGARPLCVSTPPDKRSGPFFWTYNPKSPLNAKLHFSPYNARQQAILRDFARAAILHQPLDYARTVAKDLLRYVDPTVGTPRPDSGTDADRMSFKSTVPTAQSQSPELLADQYDVKYSGVGDGTASTAGRYALGLYQAVFRIQGLMILLLLGVTIAGVVLARGTLRAAGWLFLLTAVYLFVVPVAVSSYDIRYAIPAIDVLAAGAGVGAAAIGSRVLTVSRRRGTAAA